MKAVLCDACGKPALNSSDTKIEFLHGVPIYPDGDFCKYHAARLGQLAARIREQWNIWKRE